MQFRNTFLVSLLLGFFMFSACQEQVESQEIDALDKIVETTMKEKLLRHVVIFKFKDEASEEDVNRLNESFNAVAEAIPVVKDFEWGINDSPEDFHQDFTHCYMLTFASEEDRDSVYTPHPTHQAFVSSLGAHLEKVFVVDYWTNP
ncbi:MAG: Dabb family protein [Saprospiraceae bacterium]